MVGVSCSVVPTLLRHCSLPGSFIPRILQARMLEWLAISSCRGFSWPSDRTQVLLHCRQILYHLSHQKKSWYRYIASYYLIFKIMWQNFDHMQINGRKKITGYRNWMRLTLILTICASHVHRRKTGNILKYMHPIYLQGSSLGGWF